jgi:acyl-CoA synthetase (AMP-forming)/AMP-acid ligase II
VTQVHLNMASGVRQFGHGTPRDVAVREGGRELTFGELDERSNRLATALLSRGLRPGQPVALLSTNATEYFEVSTALAKAGLPMVPLNPRNSVSDNDYILGHSGARALILRAPLAPNVEGLTDRLDHVVSFGPDAGEVGERYERVLDEADNSDPRVAVDESDPFAIAYTSGTTGRPKGVLLTHRGRVLTAYGTAIEYRLGPGRRTIAVAPMYLGAGFSFAYAGPQLGGATTVLPTWNAEEFLRLMERDRIQSAFLVPTHALQIRRVAEEPGSTFDLSSLDTLYFNAAALPVALKEWVIAAFPGVNIHELYGSTEASVVTSLRPQDAVRKAGSVGHPWFMNEVKLLDDERNPVPPGQPGELFSRSPLLMGGYLHNEEATRAATTDDGFLTVGDVAVADEEGFISIVDRKKDMIIAGGVNIYPREVEEVLAQFANVDECAVVGVPDETYGERVAAFVVARPGEQIDAAALEQHVRSRVASFKVPREWHVVDGLPRNPAGKILKTRIRESYVAPSRSGQT